MSSVTVHVLVNVILRDSLAPGGTTLELDVVNIDPGVHDVHINALAAERVVVVEGESPKTELLPMGETREALGDNTSQQSSNKAGVMNVPMEQSVGCQECERWNLVRRKQLLASP